MTILLSPFTLSAAVLKACRLVDRKTDITSPPQFMNIFKLLVDPSLFHSGPAVNTFLCTSGDNLGRKFRRNGIGFDPNFLAIQPNQTLVVAHTHITLDWAATVGYKPYGVVDLLAVEGGGHGVDTSDYGTTEMCRVPITIRDIGTQAHLILDSPAHIRAAALLKRGVWYQDYKDSDFRGASAFSFSSIDSGPEVVELTELRGTEITSTSGNETRHIAAVHAGWRLVMGIANYYVKIMTAIILEDGPSPEQEV